ncbi:sensor histidine kinase [Bacillus sp. 3255]|uniref:sensor histidine kinase n=1 Tax=Bacillus sp. 3255 TaxID=2817904 RepID=UPI0028580D20|nr:sensor histidine kinase [Bacillus sp. 3255]MDR6883309.1 sensor histidine kinase YesM [Bacillus sp. 3255]
MNIRRMLFIVIPALFIFNNAVSYYIFHSGRTVQLSYNVMLDRVLLYKQITQQTEDNLRAMNAYVAERSASSLQAYLGLKEELNRLSADLSARSAMPGTGLAHSGYLRMMETFARQEDSVMKALESPDSLAYIALYEEAERTAAFIQDEGHRLTDSELSYYRPFYRQILLQTEAMNRWGIAIFILNTWFSVVFAYAISLGITRPIRQLTKAAQLISGGNLQTEAPAISAENEFGVLSAAFGRMQDNLRELIQKEKMSLEKDKLVKELELEVLQNQINPHFLFNSLNVLSKLALIEGAERTSDLTVSMSNLLRYNLRNLDRPVTLRDEVEHAKEYFAIQQARFRDRIQFVTEIDERGLDVSMPTLTLQPILENVFVHGIEGMEKGAELKLTVFCEAGEVRVAISDNGIGMDEQVRAALLDYEAEPPGRREHGQSTGLGTRNVFKRLELFYGRKNLVDIVSRPGAGTTVLIKLPAAGKEEPHVPSIDRG